MLYIKNKAKKLTIFTKSFNIALLISCYVTVGTLYSLPPMNYVLQFGEYLTDVGNEKYGEPPYGHAELSSLKMFCDKMNIDLLKAKKLLKEANIKINNTEMSIGKIAKANGLTPQQIYNIINKAITVPVDEDPIFPKSPSPSFGKKTINDICQIYKLPVDEVLSELKEAGLSAKADNTIKEIGSNNGSNPMAIFEIIKEVATNSK